MTCRYGACANIAASSKLHASTHSKGNKIFFRPSRGNPALNQLEEGSWLTQRWAKFLRDFSGTRGIRNIHLADLSLGWEKGSSASVRDNNRAVASRVSSNRTCSSFTRAKNAVLCSKARHLSSIERERERGREFSLSLHPFLGSVTALVSIYEAVVSVGNARENFSKWKISPSQHSGRMFDIYSPSRYLYRASCEFTISVSFFLLSLPPFLLLLLAI